MTLSVVSPDAVRISSPGSLRFADPWNQHPDFRDLRVVARHPLRPGRTWNLVAGPSGVFGLHDVPSVLLAGFRELQDELAEGAPSDSRWIVEVTDPVGRFLPLRIELPFPAWQPWPASNPALVGTEWNGWGLFGAATRATPAGHLVVRADLVHAASQAPLRWARLVVSLGTKIVGTGLSDGRGRVVVAFPHPAPTPRPSSLPPDNPWDPLVWELSASVLSNPSLADADMPSFSAIAAQTESVAYSAWSDADPSARTPLPAWTQSVREAKSLSTTDHSSLFVAA